MTKEENEKRLARLKAIVSNLPDKPGSYQYYDESGTIIYVGKAKNLKNRVSSYFHKEVDRYKTKVLVSKIHDITYTVVNSEEDALLLENSLIKKYQPKYNILLKDGKTYPSICVTKEYLPRIFKTRTINKKWGSYYGPYSHLPSMYAVLDLIKKLYKPRTCRFPITREGIEQGKYKPCLEYHIKNCGAPCIGKQSYEEYQESIAQAREILKGNTRELSKMLFTQMQKLAEELRFEEAEAIKQKYLLLENFCSKSEVVSHTINNVDVFSVTDDEKTAYVNYIHVMNGSINQAFTFEMKKKLNESEDEILQLGILQIREKVGSTSREIIVPFIPDMTLEGVTFTVPQRGDKKTLLDLSVMNGKQYRFDRLKQAEKLNPEQKSVRLMKEIQNALKLPKMPYQIEMFDNSNISGTDAVAACVVFKKMKPSKKDYRKYIIKTVTGPDDYASMQEVVRRRYTRLRDEGQPLPDLIITDGGQGQMSVVREVVEGELHLDIPIAGLAKDDRHRTNELLYGWPPVVVGMKTDSELFHLLTHMQDEVHRFAITFHRDKRSKHALHSELDDIKGIGPKTKDLLLKELKTVKRIKEASIEEIAAIIGPSKAKIIAEHFENT
ncbi:uvrABC system protein C [Prevotella sp. CAG:255]|uniref:excinuclease ABC subunit UvrC n=1 Tax=Prevotella sp. CAG:255 TaxID=1262923 RepID=UPI00033B77D4|nr:excinuclease ABC subunit UvrC [Prevotella sp. CAG:255]CCX68728.1 uvrABC system protein C [Prevotella sp. CAG:255]